MYKAYAGIGSTKTPTDVCHKMYHLGYALAWYGYTLRSGGAPGADKAFEAGTDRYIQEKAADPRIKEIFLPWMGFEGNPSKLLPNEKAYEVASRFHPVWDKLKSGQRAFHARNAQQVLGENLDNPVSFVVCWTPGGRLVGGTAQALRIATARQIPVFNLAVDGAEQEIVKHIRKINDLRSQ